MYGYTIIPHTVSTSTVATRNVLIIISFGIANFITTELREGKFRRLFYFPQVTIIKDTEILLGTITMTVSMPATAVQTPKFIVTLWSIIIEMDHIMVASRGEPGAVQL